jgi:hypothetical protein
VQIKETVFKHPAFLAMTRLFVPVYLDGDTERAQSWGEHYAVAGYPTMIVFTPTGDEITRIPGWIDSEQYLNVLQLALDDQTSTADLLRQAAKDPASISTEAWSRLAFYSWEQSNLPEDLPRDPATFKTLAEAAGTAGNTEAWSRLVFQYLYTSAGALEEEGASLTPEEQQQIQQDLTVILNEPNLVLANSDYLIFYPEDFIPLVTTEGAERGKLAARWIAAMNIIRNAPQLSGAEHIASWYPQIALYWLDNPDAQRLPPELEQEVITYIGKIDSATKGEARQNVINTAYQILEDARRDDLARSMLLEEINQSIAPYYFMSSLGDLEEKEGNPEKAVDWHRRAWEGAEGEATRFQWGYQYLDSLIRLTPERDMVIVKTSSELLAEFADKDDILTGRNFGRLQSMLDSLEQWRESNDLQGESLAGLESILADVDNLCAGINADTESGDHCQTLQQ